jgi:hypothetical protein
LRINPHRIITITIIIIMMMMMMMMMMMVMMTMMMMMQMCPFHIIDYCAPASCFQAS